MGYLVAINIKQNKIIINDTTREQLPLEIYQTTIMQNTASNQKQLNYFTQISGRNYT
jgi:hypothetical protein